MARLALLLTRLEKSQLPVHITPVARQMIQEIGSNLPFPAATLFRLLLKPNFTEPVLKLIGEQGAPFQPLLRNTANANIVRSGQQINVKPSEAVVDLDGRLLPGYNPDDMIAELRRIVGNEVEFELIRYDAGPPEPDMGLFDTLASILRQADPQGAPIPALLPAATDARFFAKLGIQTYGFLPMRLPPEFNFAQTIHGADERIPVDALAFGSEAIYQLMQRFGSQ